MLFHQEKEHCIQSQFYQQQQIQEMEKGFGRTKINIILLMLDNID